MSNTVIPVKLGEQYEGTVVDVLYTGIGVIMVDDYPIHLENAFEGEKIRFEVTQVNRKFGRAKVVEIEVASPDRVDSGKDYLLEAGIAPYVNLAYDAQLRLKQQQVQKLYKAVGIDVDVAPTIGMDNPTHYRNKTVVPVKYVDGKLTTGFIKKRTPGDIVPLDDYFVNDEKIDQIIGIVRDILDAHKVSVFDDDTQEGEMRYIMVRRGYYSHEVMVVLVTQTPTLTDEDAIAADIAAAVSGIKSIILNHNPRSLHVLTSGDNRTLWGADAIHDKLLDIDFEIGPNSFYQVNPQTTERDW